MKQYITTVTYVKKDIMLVKPNWFASPILNLMMMNMFKIVIATKINKEFQYANPVIIITTSKIINANPSLNNHLIVHNLKFLRMKMK